jgi:hypothetical protein
MHEKIHLKELEGMLGGRMGELDCLRVLAVETQPGYLLPKVLLADVPPEILRLGRVCSRGA